MEASAKSDVAMAAFFDEWRCKQECAALYIAFANRIDLREYDRLVMLFTPDGVMGRKGEERQGREEIMGMLKRRAAHETVRHLITNVEITPQGKHHAEGLCYFLAFIGAGADDAANLPLEQPQVVGNLRAAFRLTDEGWRFERLVNAITFVQDFDLTKP